MTETAGMFIGRGWAFPIGVNPSGGADMVDGDKEIVQAIHLILGTDPGERPMRPEFGCAIRDYVFGSGDASAMGAVSHEVRRALDRWEPRIVVDDVTAIRLPRQPEVLHIEITYRLSHTNSRRNLVFPFYAIPADHDPSHNPSLQRDHDAPA
ncbi:GPW/gp25 family protein [Streptomyces sp. NPDC050658]|uniref:GPW/gp25 family protein n=1 Tax=unclassified Streptomyces TaxID=2593676 RepID=UPI003419F0A7